MAKFPTFAIFSNFLTLSSFSFNKFSASKAFCLSSKVLFIASSFNLKLDVKVSNVLSSLEPCCTFISASASKAYFLILSFSSCSFLSSSIANKDDVFCSLLTLSIKFCSALSLLSSLDLSLLDS